MGQWRIEKRSVVALHALLACTAACTALSQYAWALDPAVDVSQYAHTAWKVRDGFVRGPINSIAQTPDGYLWLGTEFGLYRFDGVHAALWQPPAGQQLPSSCIQQLLVAHDGTLWITTLKGLASWKDGKFTQYSEVAQQMVYGLLQDRDGTIWFGAYAPGRLCAVQCARIECYGAGSFGRAVNALYEDHQGNLWASAQTGLWRWKPGRPEQYKFPRGVTEVNSVVEGDDGALLLATNDGLKQLAAGKVQSYALQGVTGKFRSNFFFRSSDGSLWIGSQQGLLHLHQGRMDTFAVGDGLSGDFIDSIFEDREGNVWVATQTGADRFREYAVPSISRNQGLSNSTAWSVQTTPDGSIWLGTPDGLNRWRNGYITVSRKQSAPGQSDRRGEADLGISGAVMEATIGGLPGTPRSLGLDDQGQLWISTGDGVFYFKGGRFIRVPGVAGADIHAIAGDGHKNVWISDDNAGLSYVTSVTAVQSIPWSRLGHKGYGAIALLPDRLQGGVWLGFLEGGLFYFKDGHVSASYSVADGLGSGHVNGLRFGSRGTLWAATEGGLSRIRDRHVTTLTSKNGLPCDTVHWSVEDDDHFVWVYMPCGLARIARSELDAWVSDTSRKLDLTIFDNSDGVASLAAFGGYGPHVAKSPDGKIWFVHQDGVSVIDPRHLPHNKMPPPVDIVQLRSDRKSLYDSAFLVTGDTNKRLRLPALSRDLQIEYTALSLVVPEKVLFRYKLEGYDRDWVDAGNRREAFYSNLPPRNYRFRVTACNNSGVWNEEGAFLDFSIAPAYYQTNWFRALCVAAFVALLWTLYQTRLHQLQRRFNAGFEARINERTRIARELHDTLLQSLHGLLFRFQAARNMLPRRPEDAMEALDGAISRTEQAITEGQDAIANLRPEPTTSSDLAGLLRATGKELESTAITNGTPATFSLTVEGERKTLSPNLQEEIYRIARELLRNAFRHACARQIEAEVRYDDEQLRVRIRDDGKGMDPEVLKKGNRQGHWGLPGAKERAKQIGGRLDIWSEARAGTEIQLSVPARIAYENSHDRPRLKFLRRVKVDEQRF